MKVVGRKTALYFYIILIWGWGWHKVVSPTWSTLTLDFVHFQHVILLKLTETDLSGFKVSFHSLACWLVWGHWYSDWGMPVIICDLPQKRFNSTATLAPKICIVGSGLVSFYAAQHLIKVRDTNQFEKYFNENGSRPRLSYKVCVYLCSNFLMSWMCFHNFWRGGQ
jgi:hypothetical protein